MKKILLILILSLSFQILTLSAQADDIKDFEIEGMSIGDNALDFFSKNILDKNKDYYPSDRKFFRTTIEVDVDEDGYSEIQLHIKIEDNRYIIYSVSGLIYYKRSDPKDRCFKKQDQIIKDISSILTNTNQTKPENKLYGLDKTNNSTHRAVYFDFKPDLSEYAKVGCVFYGKEWYQKTKWNNHLRIAFTSSEFHYWLRDEANK